MSENEPTVKVMYSEDAPVGVVVRELEPYNIDVSEEDVKRGFYPSVPKPGETYEIPKRLALGFLLNGNFEPGGEGAQRVLDEHLRREDAPEADKQARVVREREDQANADAVIEAGRQGVDLDEVEASVRGGKITRRDVLAHAREVDKEAPSDDGESTNNDENEGGEEA